MVKMMGGKEVKAKEIGQYYKSYMEIFKGNTMPEPKSMLEVFSRKFYVRHDILPIFVGDDRSKQLGESGISKGALHGQVKVFYHLIIYTKNKHPWE